MTVDAKEPAGAPAPLAKPARAYALGVLLVIYIFNFLDRQIVNILAEPIKLELGLADWQIGVMTGLAFAVFYTVLGIPIARYAERADRVKIISVAVAVWSAFTILCGMAGNFVQLLAARIGVGVGEAGCTPPAHSLISDYTPKEKRASALALYSMGIPLGSLAGMVLGGLIADAYGWRMAFFVAGAPGILLALIAWFTLPEPRRKGLKKITPAPAASRPNILNAMAEMKDKTSFWWISVGAALSAMIGYGHIAFYGSFYLRNHGEGLLALATQLNDATGLGFGPIGFIGTALGLLFGICGAAGTYVGGILADRSARVNPAGYAIVPAIATALTVPPFVAAMLVGDAGLSLLVLAVPIFFGAVWYGPVFASAQSLVEPHTRATAAAVLLFIINLVGLGLGPLSVGLVSDALAVTMGAAEGLRWSMVIFGLVALLSAGAFFMAARTLKDEIVS
ncbi:spinster family MFS transporter [Alkalicaulis satelles]|uniref:spinster family MFS transporter n=1 Tax=Alkalicaulis satelles TaxID=2609175 RepID=UPI001E480CCF|nr:MFS transporter [Alkalicaulis satelles]